MLEAIRKTESPEPHRFLLDALARMPDAVPLLIPLLASPRWHEARHAADVLGRQMVPEALAPLRSLLAHSDARVRGAAVEALARYPAQYGTEGLRAGLRAARAERSSAALDAVSGACSRDRGGAVLP